MFWLACLLACARFTVAIYPEQLGEFDWLLQGLGRTTLSVFHQKRLLVATDGGVIASVNVVSGLLDWRVVLPKHTSVEQFVFADASPVYAHTVDAAAGSSAVQVFNASSGSMLWEHTFSASGGEGLLVDMQVSEVRHQLLVLAGNCLHVFSTTSGLLLWSWQPEAGSRVQLSSLIVPEQPPKRAGPSRVAVGCVLGSDQKCSKTALVTADFDEQKCSLQLLAALPGGGPWQSLRASVAEQGGPQVVDSVLFASTTHVGVLSIASGKVASLAWPDVRANSEEDEGPVEARTFALVVEGSGGAAVQVASRCSATTCELFRVAGLQQGMPSLQRLVGCAGSASALLLQRFPSSTSAVRHAGCALAVSPEAGAAKTCASDSSCSASTAVTVRTLSLASADAGSAPSVHEFKAELPNQAFSALRHAALSAFRTPKLEASARVLLVTSAGSTLLLQHAIAKGPATLELLWRREEALASVAGAVMLDAHKPGLGAAHPHAEEEDLISWRGRLGLQVEDAQDALARLVEAVQELATLPERVSSMLLSVGGALEHTFPFSLMNGGQRAPFRGLVSKEVRVTLSPAARASAQSKARRFGFDKLGVTLSPRSGGGLVLVGIDLLSAEPLWVAELSLPSPPSFAKVFALSRTEVCLVASSGGRSLVFRFDAASGAVGGGGGVSRARVLSAAHADVAVEGHVLSVFQMDASHGHGHGRHRFHLLLEAAGAGGARKVVPYPLPSEGGAAPADSRGGYVHHLDEASGRLDTYRVLPLRAGASEHALQAVATAVFEPSSERIVSAAAPSAQDTVNSLFTTLGDDSLLLKYVNPHTLLVASVSPPHAAAAYYGPRDDDEAALVQLHLTLVDTVSAKIIYRASLDSGTAPVHAVLVENALVATYWNARTKRCELSSVALFEGMIDRYGLTPLASKQSAAAAQAVQQRRNFSAFSSLGPLAMQKTFVLPKTVTAAHHTVTAQGIANKNLLLGTASGQVFALDARQISPRRPLTEPSQGEREEGLLIYQPFLFLSPLAAVTHNYNLAAGPELIVSAAARLESSSLVLAASRCDLAFNRWLSSGGFDMLASDFNAFSLVMLLVSLAVLVLLLQRAARAKALKSSWQ